MADLTRTQRAALALRWNSKVVQPNGARGCWGWTGAMSRKRNGKRGVIRVGGVGQPIMSAKRVGLLLAQGAKFSDPALAKLDPVHVGVELIEGCVNPRHHRWGKSPKTRKANKGKGEGHATSTK